VSIDPAPRIAAPEPPLTVAVAGLPGHGQTPREVARFLRVNAERVRAWILAGELGAIDTARHRCGKPRYVILPQHLAEFVRRRAAASQPKPAPRRKRQQTMDFYPDAP
jgi:hypothetical protein